MERSNARLQSIWLKAVLANFCIVTINIKFVPFNKVCENLRVNRNRFLYQNLE